MDRRLGTRPGTSDTTQDIAEGQVMLMLLLEEVSGGPMRGRVSSPTHTHTHTVPFSMCPLSQESMTHQTCSQSCLGWFADDTYHLFMGTNVHARAHTHTFSYYTQSWFICHKTTLEDSRKVIRAPDSADMSPGCLCLSAVTLSVQNWLKDCSGLVRTAVFKTDRRICLHFPVQLHHVHQPGYKLHYQR